MRTKRLWWIPVSAALVGCQSEVPVDGGPVGLPEPTDVRPVVRSSEVPPPISGGTLTVLADGHTAVAADSDRDLVHVVDLDELVARHTIELREGDEPGRLVADDRGRVHVIARRGGVVLTVDPHEGRVLERRSVCANPRGLAFDAADESIHVACAGGDLVTLPVDGGEATRRVWLGPDLRDVMLLDGRVAVSRLRSAHVLLLDDAGEVLQTMSPPDLHKGNVFDALSSLMRPNVAWRTIATPDGEWLMVHQMSTTKTLDPHPEPGHDGGGTDGFGGEDGGNGGGYGGGGPDRMPCGAVVNPVITIGSEHFTARGSGFLEDTVLPVDVATSTTGSWIAVAVAGRLEGEEPSRGVVMLPTSDLTDESEPGCREPRTILVETGQYVAVAFDPMGNIIAQSREPAHIVKVNPFAPDIEDRIDLPGASVLDTGHDLFHRDAGKGISCATCHPEGGDDGRVWTFEGMGPRHTPSLAVGLRDTEPFHWVGDLADMNALVDEVHVGRMGGHRLSPARVEALQSWMFEIPPMRARRGAQDESAQRGAASFAAWGCGECHRGEALDGGSLNVERGMDLSLQVPPLRGVAQHPPYMHDGRASDLRAAIVDMLVRTRPQLPMPSSAELDDMVAYLETL